MPFPIPFPTFQPAMRLIVAITKDFPAVVTTDIDHQYINGAIIRLYVYPENGMTQANQLAGAIEVVTPTTFKISINTHEFDTFIVPGVPTANNTQACCVPVGEVSSTLKSATRNAIPY